MGLDLTAQASVGAAKPQEETNSGLIVSGPPGCGKTAAVYACAAVRLQRLQLPAAIGLSARGGREPQAGLCDCA